MKGIGIVGWLAAIGAILAVVRGARARGPEEPAARWMEARWYDHTERAVVELVILHSTEGTRSAYAQARDWQIESSEHKSAHYICDAEQSIQCVPEACIAWTAKTTANHKGIQLELVGFALSTNWLAEGRHTLERAARLVRAICSRWQIPMVKLGPAELLEGQRGICSHASCSTAWRESTHQDPGGPGDHRFPWPEFLAMVREG